MRILRASLLLLVAGGLLSSVGIQAQSTNATVNGLVTDITGAVIVGASVQAINENTNIAYPTTTNESGVYSLPILPPGKYRMQVSHPAFKTVVKPDIILNVQDARAVNFTLEVGATSETVTVQSALPLINTESAGIRQVVDSRAIGSIPLNGRNYLDLVQLSPGVTVNTNARSDLTDRDTRGAILGERAGNAAFLVNGFENNDDFHGGVFQNFAQDVIQEFEVVEAGYKAEFGRGSGGVVNVVTKSGTNAFHGSGFLFLRNDALDTSNVAGETPPQLARYDYGFTMGGPIRRDKSWFFGSLEQFQETRGAIFPSNIPETLRAGEDFNRQPETRNLLAFAKYDRHLNVRNDLHAEVSFSRRKALNELATATSLPSSSNNSVTKTMLGTLSLTTMFNPHLVLDSSFSVRGQNFDQNRGTRTGQSFSVFFLDDGSSFDFGPPAGSVQTLHQRYYTAREQLSRFSGSHTSKVGVDYIRTIANGENGQGFQNVIVTIHPFFALYGTGSFQIPQGVGFFNPGDNLTRLANNGVSLYGQDDWRVHKRLLLSGGIRYDYDSKFGTHNVAPRLGLAISLNSKSVVKASWGIFYDRYRLGIVQAVPEFGGFNGRTVVELNYPRLAVDALVPFPGSIAALARVAGGPTYLNAQFGIPVGALVSDSNIQSLTGMTPSQFAAAVNAYLATLGRPFVPVDFSPGTGFLRQDLGAAFQDEIRAQKPFRTPYNTTLTVGWQQQILPDLAVGISYVHRNMHDILGLRIPNLAFESRTLGAAVTTDGGPLQRTYGPWYSGIYNAAILTVEKRFAHRFQLQANYIKAKSIDNLLNSNLGLGIAAQGGGAVPTDNLNVNFDRGNSDLAVPDSFVLSGLVSLPAGFSVSGVARATSGTYFTAAGTPTDYDGDGIVSTRPPGTSRNQFRGPRTGNLDLRAEKKFTFAERYTASALIEFFNITNAANPKLIDNFWVNGAPGPKFGKTRVPLPGREIQLGFRFEF
ncbi:MAG TPA: TonB-dependent receptor [Terriglobales bacterium]|nr:TonB-dependent receptor [Terriglobales bacterium]